MLYSIKPINLLFFFSLLTILLLSSCKTSNLLFLSKNKKLENKIIDSKIFKNEFTGFILYDLEKEKEVVNINGNKFFTPASNTKLFTYYTALKVLKDSLPLLRYIVKDDSLTFWGTGSPLCLNPNISYNNYTLDFLKNRKETLFYCEDNYNDEKFGSGWAWDDYLYYYQLEKNPFPIFGNTLNISFGEDSIEVSPNYFIDKISYIKDSNEYWRPINENSFIIGQFENEYKLEIPFVSDKNIVRNIIRQQINKNIKECNYPVYDSTKVEIYKIPMPDSIYVRLLHQSDNFIAEQLMLLSSFVLFDSLNTKKAINWSKENILPELKDNCRWVDGSGLSRYNLFSPENLIYVLKKIYKSTEWEQITKVFPSAGESGTLKNSYTKLEKPYIYAKSGTLSNNHNLSGYIITKKGNKYIFSFMHNHYLGSSRKVKAEMGKVFWYIYEKY